MADANETIEQQRKLDAFLVDNSELEALNARLAAFNLFRVLRIERTEIRHSNVLAWLLTPDETHGLGDLFLRRFLSRLLMENDDADVSLTPAQVELMDFADVEVLREWQNIDVLARSRRDGWCLLIENKIGSKEKKGALARYRESALAEMPEARIIPVLLSVEGDEPSEQGKEVGYIALSHSQILELAERIVGQNQSRIPAAASVFLDHYMDVLRRITMQDDELVSLCKTIYHKHREAIDLIVEYGGSSGLLDACEEVLPELIDCEFIHHRGGGIWFLPAVMSKMPDVTMSEWRFLPRPVPIVCWVNHAKQVQKLCLSMEVGPIVDHALRVRLLERLKKAGFSFREIAFKDGAKYTRIASTIRKLPTTGDGALDDSAESISQLVRSMWKPFWEQCEKIEGALNGFEWQEES